MTTFKDFEKDRNLPEAGNAFAIFDIPNYGGVEWQNNDNTLKLKDYDDWAKGTTSGAVKLATNVGWRVVLKVETQNNNYFGSTFGFQRDPIYEMSEYIQQSSSPDHSGVSAGDSIIITMPYGSYLEIDVDAVEGNGISRFKLNLPDTQITSTNKINDEVWIELISADFMGTQEAGTGDGSEGTGEVGGAGFDEFDPEKATYWEQGINFNRMVFYAESKVDFVGSTGLRLNNNDTPFVNSAGMLFQVAEGRYVDVEIRSENRGYFNDIKASLSLDPSARDLNLDGGDPYFTYRFFGGSVLTIDIDDEHGLGTGFSLVSPTGSYSVDEYSDNDWDLKITGFGDYTRLTEEDILIGGGGGTTTTTTVVSDPFGLFDGYNQIISEEDGLIDRLLASISFGIRTSFRAIEAVIEGAFIALPAIIVIVSALVVAKVIIKLTENGAESVIEDIGAVV